MAERHLPALLVIMDGCGLAPEGADNAVAAATALRHLQHMPETRQHAEDADGLEAYARWCEDEMHRHAMAFLTAWAETGRDELCRLTRKLSPSAGDPLPLLRPDD